MHYTESDLHFQFDPSWIVRKYDHHRFYKGLSGAGLKAVDFIGIYKGKEVIFLEVKNYKVRFRGKPLQPMIDRLQHPELFVESIVRKVYDSMLGVDVIRQYFERNPLYRWIYPLLEKIPLRFFSKSSWLFWTHVHELMHLPDAVHVIIWLELEHNYEEFPELSVEAVRNKIREQLEQQLNEVAGKIHLAHTGAVPFRPSLKVWL
jgi:hypothetical protein